MVWSLENTVKPLNSGHVGVSKILSVIERYPLLEGNLRRLSHYRLNVLTTIHGISSILMSAIARLHCTFFSIYL